MSLFGVFEVAGSGMAAQTLRLNTISSNLANAESVSGTEGGVYRARNPVFSAMMSEAGGGDAAVGVKVLGIVEKAAGITKRHEPDNPFANEEGFVFHTNVNPIEEMANMISASRTFQNNVEVLNTTKQLLLATIKLGE